jgi:hypothetical protein
MGILFTFKQRLLLIFLSLTVFLFIIDFEPFIVDFLDTVLRLVGNNFLVSEEKKLFGDLFFFTTTVIAMDDLSVDFVFDSSSVYNESAVNEYLKLESTCWYP